MSPYLDAFSRAWLTPVIGSPLSMCIAMSLAKMTSRLPMNRLQFDDMLRQWLTESEDRIGNSKYGGTPWLWVVSQTGELCHLNADTKDFGVKQYIALFDAMGEKLEWVPVLSAKGSLRKLAFGPNKVVIPGFYLYLKNPRVAAAGMQ